MKTLRTFFAIAVLLISLHAFGLNQYWVSASGSDSNDGSQAHPWLTLNHADSALSVGSAGSCQAGAGWITLSGIGACVHVASGTYSSSITTNRNGSSSAAIAYISDTHYGAKLNPNSNVIWANHGTYTDIEGFDIDGSGHSTAQYGIVNYAENNLIARNRMHDMASGCNSTNTAGMQSSTPGTSGHANDYEGNLLYHNNCGSGHSVFAGNGWSSISLHAWDNARNNIILDQSGGYALQVSHSSNHNIVTNNTVLNSSQGGIIVGFINFGTGPVTQSTISNNIVANSGNAGIRVASDGCGTGTIFKTNLLYGNTGGNYEFDGGCGNTATGTQSGSNTATFVNYTGTSSGDHHSKSGSTAIDTGSTVCALTGCPPSIDFDGNARPVGLFVDIGAYEFGGATVTKPAPPTGLTAIVH